MQAALLPSLAEAQALVNVRDDERRKAAIRRDKNKQRSSKGKDAFNEADYPGAIPGAEADTTTLWLSTEVCAQLKLHSS